MTYRGTTNRNARGSASDRRVRREWLVTTFRADVDVLFADDDPRFVVAARPAKEGTDLYGDGWRMACRCYRCGDYLNADTVSPDRIKPGCEGGTYRRTNIRPACEPCQSKTGGVLGALRRYRNTHPNPERQSA